MNYLRYNTHLVHSTKIIVFVDKYNKNIPSAFKRVGPDWLLILGSEFKTFFHFTVLL